MRGVLAFMAAVVMGVTLGQCANRSLAHGDASWIGEGGYRDPVTGEGCCGVGDCEPVDGGNVEETREGWKILSTGERIPKERGMQSRDGRVWRCHRPDGSLRCFFFLPGMS